MHARFAGYLDLFPICRDAALWAVVRGLLLVLAIAPNATAQAMTSEQRAAAEGYGAAYIRALNAGADGDARAINELFTPGTIERVGIAAIQGQWARLRQSYSPLEYHHSEVSEHARGSLTSRFLHVFARASGEKGWKDFQFRLEANPPYRILELVFIAEVAEPVYLPNGDITDPGTLKWLNDYIAKLVQQNGLSGSVLIAVGDRPLYERVYGFADAKGATPVAADTRFNLGSGNKMMTAVAIAQLAEKGLLSYTDPLSKYFPDFPNADHAKKATIHHLLSHTSGVAEYWTDEYEKHWNNIRTPADQLPWVYKAGVKFAPGAEYRYSNSNFVLAGLIVEKVSKMSYFDYVRKYIYEPAGMQQSDHYLMDGSVKNLAARLTRAGSGWTEAPHGARGGPAGGGYSTPHDMLKFLRAFIGGKLVSAATVKTMTTSKTTGIPADGDYGYGFILSRMGQNSFYGHGGIARGVNFELSYFPASDTTLVMFCNQDNGAYDDLRKNITKLITGFR